MVFRCGNGGVPLQEVQNRRRVVYYAILLLLILGELLEEINYIIVKFPEYNTSMTSVRGPLTHDFRACISPPE